MRVGKWFGSACFLAVTLGFSGAAAQDGTPKPAIERATAASVLILTGEGGGRVKAIGTGVITSADGVIFTALHVVRGASEVQVRLGTGDVYDQVQLLASDTRRDVAALKIAAHGLPFLTGATDTPAVGDAVYAVTSANGLGWSATSGIVSALRTADEVPGAGSGFRLIQFTAPVAPGASGGALVSSTGKLLGIITSGMGAGTAFAVPAESVMGLPDGARPSPLGSGALLQPPAKEASQLPSTSSAVANSDPKEMLKNARTVYLHSNTAFLTIDTLQRALLSNKKWKQLGLVLVGDRNLADLLIEVDRPLFTYVHTFVLSDRKTTVVLGSGKRTAFDGTTASGGLANDIADILASARLPGSAKK